MQSHEFAALAPTRGSGTDYSGHGTLVAGIAAGSSAAHPGAAPQADIVSLRVMNEEGRAITSDVIAAADWIYENRRSLNIRVVNFSLHSPYPNYSLQDPLNEAVRRLWLTGTVVVAASGNAGAGRMLHAPASDPFVITVGASDTSGTRDAGDDVNAPWSSYGYTAEGFAKPELAAPGRYLVGPVSVDSLVGVFPDRVVAPGYMWMSGTSFAAPVVAGVAARIVALHPTWTPDQVKGALMLGARPLAGAAPMSAGVGQIDAAAAAAATDPPNPNASLDRFVAHDARVPGRRVFDVGAWSLAAWSSAAWSSAAWSSAAWADAAWSSAAWADAAWSSAAWADAAWADAAWADAAWSSASWAEAAWADALVGAEGG